MILSISVEPVCNLVKVFSDSFYYCTGGSAVRLYFFNALAGGRPVYEANGALVSALQNVLSLV